MARSQHFANYPAAMEARDVEYRVEEDKNPALRGLPMVIASAIVSRSVMLQKYLYGNAGFGKLKDIPGICKESWRLQPTVIPLAEPGAVLPSTPEFGEELYTPQAADRIGRYYSVADYHELYKSGELTPLQVVEALFPLINRERQPRSEYATAWLDIHEEEALEAAKASTERWVEGKPLGILDGVPFGVKADIEVKGFVNTMGMKVNKSIPYFNTPCDFTVWPVQRLEEAGAIMVGKMNQHEGGMDTTGCNPSTGTAINWMNRSYYPGGSSSGAGSSLGAGLVPIAVGTDAGGSIRIPPNYAGAYGLKTSHHRTCVRNSTTCIIGPMTSTVADLTVAYRVMAQSNPDDSIQGLFAPSVAPDPSAKKYLGVCWDWVNRASPVVLDVFKKTLDHYKTSLGYEVVDIKIPYLREGQLAHSALCLCEAADEARARAPPGGNWLDLLNYPNKVLFGVGAQTTAGDYLKFAQVREALMRHLAALYQRYPGLLVVTPTTADPGWRIHPGDLRYGMSDGNMSIRNMMFCWLANVVGCPSVTAPVGYVDPDAGTGKLPVGMLAMGEWGAEEQLLVWAGEAETYINSVYPGGRLRPEGWVDVLALARRKNGSMGKDSQQKD
ncbi:N-acylethanolamine amidohydrolase [Pleurostoma richardsiae]|uniref:N-acylethanolamine amidohydrolase n=1 Tax=Pleurostoma richardsiae TaxID=41990 RepID=A0AA38VTD0_9PEZI|nr:N-acylethanolamine amidohydrolase [Pleurostoma richardsiae]